MADPVLCLQQDASDLAAGEGEEYPRALVLGIRSDTREQPIDSAGTEEGVSRNHWTVSATVAECCELPLLAVTVRL